MGLAFSIDTPIKVAHFGIDSVISIVDDDLIEKMRKVHSQRSGVSFEPISIKEEDYRAKRITAYLNLVSEIVQNNFTLMKKSFGEPGGDCEKYISMLPDDCELKLKYEEAKEENNLFDIKDYVISNLRLGSIDVNIMTKVDKANYLKNEQLPVIFNDAHAALRGFAKSNLKSSIVLSAGMNPRLYSYFEELQDFYPDKNGELNKKIILKVSDYRSAIIQGKFLAKKGLWISEYRIESGLNCGGHAFATDGFLMGPILEEFKTNRESLINITHEIYTEALLRKNKPQVDSPFPLKITAQGGVGTFEEQNFLLDHYSIDSVGWGTPFLLVPEATNVDEKTLELLSNAKEEDLYLSRISPLGVPFNSIKGNTKDIEKLEIAATGKPGSPCPKQYLKLNTEYEGKPICTASRTFQSRKVDELKLQDAESQEYKTAYDKIIDKACLCVGLATSVLMQNDAATKIDGNGVLICPGPNLAYFSSVVSLTEMVDHIYGRINLIKRNDRPNMFLKELKLYLNYLMEEINSVDDAPGANRIKYFNTYQKNISEGIEYYKHLFGSIEQDVINVSTNTFSELVKLEKEFDAIKNEMILLDLLPATSHNYLEVSTL